MSETINKGWLRDDTNQTKFAPRTLIEQVQDNSGVPLSTFLENNYASISHTHSYAGSSSAGGAADSANILNSDTRLTYGWNGVNYFNISGTAGNAAGTNDTPTTAWWHIMRFNHANATGYYTDLAIPFNATSLYYKRIAGGTVQNSGWVKVLDSLNYSDYCAPASHTHNYVPYSSGVGTVAAGLNISSNGAYIYSDSSNPGNIYFRYTASSGASYSYANLASIISGINSKLPLTGGTVSGSFASNSTITAGDELRSMTANGLRIVYKDYGFIIRNDGYSSYFLLTNSADQYGSWSSLRPLIINNATGAVSIGNGLTVSGTLTASTISIGGIGTLKSTIADSGSYIWLQGNSGVSLYLGYDGRCVVPPTGAAGVRGATNNSLSCGHSSYLWTTVYAKTTAISSSDRNTKKDFRTFDSNENYEKFFMDLKPTIFKYIDGTSNRDHFGYISQDVEESLYKYGFDDLSFAGFCRDIKVDDNDEPVLDENGDVQWLYALRYEEFISLNTYMIQKLYEEKDALQEENTDLKSRVEKLEELVAQLIA